MPGTVVAVPVNLTVRRRGNSVLTVSKSSVFSGSETGMQFRNYLLRSHRVRALASIVVTGLFASLLLVAAVPTPAQSGDVAQPGDAPATEGPIAHLSPKLSKRKIAKGLKLVANWQLGRLPAYAQYDWTWATLYDGLLAVPPRAAGSKFEQAMMNVGEKLNWQPGPRVMHADDQAIGQTYLELYFLHKDWKMIEPMQERLGDEMATPDPVDSKLPLWWWCDALFMAPPVWSRMYAATHDSKYLDYLDRHW